MLQLKIAAFEQQFANEGNERTQQLAAQALLATPLKLDSMLQQGAVFAWQHYAPDQVLPIWQQLFTVQRGD